MLGAAEAVEPDATKIKKACRIVLVIVRHYHALEIQRRDLWGD